MDERKNINAKNPRWEIPMKLSGVTPEDYASDMASSSNSKSMPNDNHVNSGPPDYTLPGHPTSNKTAPVKRKTS